MAPKTTDKESSNTKVDTINTVHAKEIDRLGKEIIIATGRAAGLYFELAEYIRENKVPPTLVSARLKQLGFAKTRISEIQKVAGASDATWSSYEAKAIGFKKVLELARRNTFTGEVEPTEATKLLTDRTGLTDEEKDEAIDEQSTANPERGKKNKGVPRKKQLEELALRMAKIAGETRHDIMKFPVKEFGWEVTMSPINKAGAN